jgi:hypothetical protein
MSANLVREQRKYLESSACEDGITMPYDPETGEELCHPYGFSDLESKDADLSVGTKLVDGSTAGTPTFTRWKGSDRRGHRSGGEDRDAGARQGTPRRPT